VIELFNVPRKIGDISLNPDQIRVVQGAPGNESDNRDGFHVSVNDDIGNPYCLRNYSISIQESNGQFPGWLNQTYLGVNEQLGGTVLGRLSSAGGMNATYIPPDYAGVQWNGTAPPLDHTESGQGTNSEPVSWLETSYEINDEVTANISIVKENGSYVDIASTIKQSGFYEPTSDGASVSLTLEYPPQPGTLHVYDSPTGKMWDETYALPTSYEYQVNHRYATVKLPPGYLSSGNSLYVEYNPLYAYPDPQESNLIWLHPNKLFGTGIGSSPYITVNYDALIRLEVTIEQAISGEFVKEFPIVIQNPETSNKENAELAREF
jgi:hypothetical protein